jgi:hypothetical protein
MEQAWLGCRILIPPDPDHDVVVRPVPRHCEKPDRAAISPDDVERAWFGPRPT